MFRKLNCIEKKKVDLGIPLAYIRKYQHFYDQILDIHDGIFIPRSDTECLIDYSIKHVKQKAKVLELGTGSGAIAVALKHARPDLYIHAIDINPNCIELAKHNANKYNCKINFYVSNWFENVSDTFDLIISNPPYVLPNEEVGIETIMEPNNSLFSTTALSKIVGSSKKYLEDEKSWILIEHGSEQRFLVEQIFFNFFSHINRIYDLSGNYRATSTLIEPNV